MKQLRIIDQVLSTGSKGWCEDIFGQAGNFAWVMDGATALLKHDRYTPKWLVEEADRVFREGAETCDSIKELAKYYQRSFILDEEYKNIAPGAKPSFALSMVMWNGKTLEYTGFADCFTFIRQGNEITKYQEPKWANDNISGPPPEFFNLPKEEQKQSDLQGRSMMNKPGGYWIGTADGIAFDHVPVIQIEIAENSEILMCSDGFERAVGLFRLYNWEEVFDAKLVDVVTDLRAAESGDPGCQKFPRSSVQDDAVAIKLILG